MSRPPRPSGDFSDRYRIPAASPAAGSAADERAVRESALESLGARPGRLCSLAWFEDVLRDPGRFLPDGPVIGAFCNFAPEELIEAAGAVPVRLCTGSIVAESVAEQTLPRDICPVARASFGAVAGRLGLAAQAKALVLPVCCDAKRRLGEVLNDYLPVISLSVPPRSDHRTELDYWLSELERVAESLSEVTGSRVTRGRLREGILRGRARADAFRSLEKARLRFPHMLAGRDLALVAAASFVAEPLTWADNVRQVADELRARGPDTPLPVPFLPLVLTGAPVLWPGWKLYEVIEGAGGTVVADTLCSVTQRLYDPVEVDDWSRSGMMRALALRSFSGSLCPCFIDTTAQTDRVIELVQEWRARGVVAHNLRLCQLFEMQCARLRHVLRSEGIPFLAVHTELGTQDTEQIRVRVEAFLEMLREQQGSP